MKYPNWSCRGTIEQMCAQRNKAITALIKLQSYAVTDEEILNIHELLIRARLENGARIPVSGVSAVQIQ